VLPVKLLIVNGKPVSCFETSISVLSSHVAVFILLAGFMRMNNVGLGGRNSRVISHLSAPLTWMNVPIWPAPLSVIDLQPTPYPHSSPTFKRLRRIPPLSSVQHYSSVFTDCPSESAKSHVFFALRYFIFLSLP
jgi:hypothetical protein